MAEEPDGYFIHRRDFPDFELLLREFRSVGRTLRRPDKGGEGRPGSGGGRVLLGKPDPSNVAKGSSGTFTIYNGTKGSETATSRTVEAYCRSAAITTDQMAYIQKVNGGWEAVPAECPDPEPEPEE